MSGCGGCWQTKRGQQEEIIRVRSKAKQYAIEKKVTVAIYREGYEVFFCTEQVARDNKYLVIEFLSPYK